MAIGEYLGNGSAITKGLYHLNGNANDSSGNGNNGTPTNITYVPGIIGSQAASFNGSSSLVSIPDNDSLDFGTGDFTINFWADTCSTAAFYGGKYISKMNSSSLDGVATGWNIGGSGEPTTSKIQFITWNGNANTAVSLSVTGWSGVWKMLTFTRVGTTLSIYVNATLVGSNSGTVRNVTTARGMEFGRYNWDNSVYYSGKMDEVIMENVGWDITKIKKQYTYQKGRFASL